MPANKPKTVDEYIEAAPEGRQEKLRELRSILKEVAPDAKESLKWGAPVFEEKRILFSYEATRTHLNFAPTPAAVQAFKNEMTGYVTGKATIQFPYDRPLPKDLIQRIAIFRIKDVRENDARWM